MSRTVLSSHRFLQCIAAAIVLSCLAGSAVAGGKAPRKADRAALAGFSIGSGNPPLALQVEVANRVVVSSAPAAEGGGNVRAVRSGDDGAPMLSVSFDLAVAIKFDLYLSDNGEDFIYTSSCALTPGISSFEMWQQPVRAFALGNPRVVEDGKTRCD